MSRSQRLLTLLQSLRRRRHAVSGAVLAEELGVSLRTVYRDIAVLQDQGASIVGGAGTGFLLKPGFTLPPLMFTTEEIEALVLGSRWVASRGDAGLATAAEHALAKIGSVVPSHLLPGVHDTALRVGPSHLTSDNDGILHKLRLAIRDERRTQIAYTDEKGVQSERMIWPFVLGYFDSTRVVGGWCELRQAIRHFRVDRISTLQVSDQRYPARRSALIRQWEHQEGLET